MEVSWFGQSSFYVPNNQSVLSHVLFFIPNLSSCAEVLLLSTIFAVQQMPVFGDGLVESNCAACFLVDTKILPEFSVLCIGTILNVGVNVWLYRKAHGILFSLP